jgi:hypothetical protein
VSAAMEPKYRIREARGHWCDFDGDARMGVGCKKCWRWRIIDVRILKRRLQFNQRF